MGGPPWLLPHSHPDYQTVSLWSLIEGGPSLGGVVGMCVSECTCASTAWGALPCLCFLLCVDDGLDGGGQKQLWVGLWILMMFVGRCVCFCVCAKEGEVCPWSKPFEVLHIWAVYLERMQCRANTHRKRENGERRDVFIVLEPVSLLICRHGMLILHRLYFSKCSKISQGICIFTQIHTVHGPADRHTDTHTHYTSQVQQDKQLHSVDKKAAMTTKNNTMA